MGKRKYNSGDTESSKKLKATDNQEDTNHEDSGQPQNQHIVPNSKNSSRKHDFDLKHFRKELSSKQGQTMVLTQFLNVCLNPDNEIDYILEYLKIGGNSHEILRQITQDNKKNLTLATPAFHLFHLIILKVQSSMPHMITITEEACRYFLNTFIPTVEIMISENSGPRHRKIILNLLTSMVTLNSDLGVEILNQLPLTPKHLQYIIEKPNYKEKDNVRTAFVHFMTSFLIEGHLPLIKALLEKQGLLGLVIPGLVQDEAEAVLIFLNILNKNIIKNQLISKTLKLKTFSQQVLHNMFKVFSWKGPPQMNNELRNELRPEIINLLTDILMTLFTSHKLGLYFLDNSLGTSDSNKNQNLYKSLLSLKRPWENENECEVILKIIFKCPDLHRAIINVVEQSFEPQHSPIWERTVEFTIKLIDTLKPEEIVQRMKNLNPVQTANFVRFVTLPVPLLKHIQPSIGKDRTISLYCAKVLVKMLQSLKYYIKILNDDDSNLRILELKNKLEYFIPKHFPLPGTIVSLIQDIIKGPRSDEPTQDYRLPTLDDADELLVLIELLLLFNDIYPGFYESLEGNIDMKTILDYSRTMSGCTTYLLKFKVVSLWLTLDDSAMSINNPMFGDLFRIMLDVYINQTDDTWAEAKDILQVYFKNTTIFEGDEDEIHLVLYTLRNVEVNPMSLIIDMVEYAIANKQELTEFVRSQILHFEISNANEEDNLESLFNALMTKKSIDDNVFMQSKVPSPFIVGCLQYTQNNKEAKKKLKHFLSLYVANLLHCNYSPEMTEILMGDSKLDVRSYVASWVGEPIPLPEIITGKDKVLYSLSQALVGRENLTIKDIFVCLEESTEDKDVAISNNYIKITGKADSSELRMWASFLAFCLVKLTEKNKLSQAEVGKLKMYFDCIIALGKKYHMLQECRDIILNIFKNTYVLNVYTPVDLTKNESKVNATQFLFHILTQHSDIVNYLDNKHNVLQPYKMKNYKDIMKTLVKIKKRNETKCDHTVRIIKEVGLRKEDDVLILKHIFDAELCNYVRDDKEPSLLLEILCVVIEKYSKSMALNLSQDTFLKTTNLYFQLLKTSEINVNLNGIEEALITLFKKKPQYVNRVSEEKFRVFFQSNTLSKSTSQLASILLKFNKKFCNVFKEEINRAEVLSQRELTLPLGNAILNHNTFLTSNKEFLTRIYDEYKSNINKYLEKPHKAGQVYLKNWKFIRKLTIECMDVESCTKIFNKMHKFEIIDVGHMNLFHSIFLKICLFVDQLKIDYVVNYFLSILHLIAIAIKEESDADVLHLIANNVLQVIHIFDSASVLQIKQEWDFVKVTESPVWQNFCKSILKHSLKVKTAKLITQPGPKLLCLLTRLVKLFYPANHEDIVTIFDMVTSHSEFLNVMLSHHSPEIKSRLLEILCTLISLNKSVMKSQQIPVYLSAYGATRSSCDRLILSILYLYESNEQPVNEFKPYVWGDSAANYYSVRKTRTSSLWGHPTPNQVLNLFDKELIERTIRNFPVTQKLEYTYQFPEFYEEGGRGLYIKDSIKTVLSEGCGNNEMNIKSSNDSEAAIKALLDKARMERIVLEIKEDDIAGHSHTDSDSEIYDPVFVFSLLSHLLAPGSVASCFKLLRTGVLSVPVMGLSSYCPSMRSAAYHVLHRFSLLLETETRHKNDKLLLTDFIGTLRQSLTSAITAPANGSNEDSEVKNPRLPAIDALYLARALMVSTAPFDPMYKPVNNFLIAKQFVDLSVVPDFLSLFHDSDVESTDRRQWVIDVIRDGTKTMTDVNVVFKSMCLKMMMDFYCTVICDRRTREKILGALNSIITIPRALEILIQGYGLLSWLHCVVRQVGRDDRCIVVAMFELLGNILHSLRIAAFCKSAGLVNGRTLEAVADLKVDKDIEIKVLLIANDLSKHLEGLELIDIHRYVSLFKSITRRTIKLLTKKQILNLINKCTAAFSSCESVELLSRAVVNGALLLRSEAIEDLDDLTTDRCIIKELAHLLRTYLA